MAEGPSNGLKYPSWQIAVQEAVLEFKVDLLQQRIEAAENAINARLQELSISSNGHAERQAIQDALNVLRVLKERRARTA
jgi:inhibitor of KinA sporulation pathway (predicted exonuclease)